METPEEYHELILVEFRNGKVYSPDQQMLDHVYDEDEPGLWVEAPAKPKYISRCLVSVGPSKYIGSVCGAEVEIKVGKTQKVRDVWYGKYFAKDDQPACSHWREIE